MRPECEQLTTHCGQDTFQEGESSIEIFPEKERPKRKSLDQAVGSSWLTPSFQQNLRGLGVEAESFHYSLKDVGQKQEESAHLPSW